MWRRDVTPQSTEQGRKSRFICLSLHDVKEEKKRRGEEIIGDLGISEGRGSASHLLREQQWADAGIFSWA